MGSIVRLRKMFGERVFVVLLLAGIAVANPVMADAPNVVVSIKPIHSLVASVMKGVGTPHLLLQGSASPHTYSLRPSGARALEQADVVFWVGEVIEHFLIKSLPSVATTAQIVELMEEGNIRVLPARVGGTWEAHAHEEDKHDAHGHYKHGHDDHTDEHRDGHKEAHAHNDEHAEDKHGHDKHAHDEHAPEQLDGHIWLDPRNGAAIVEVAARVLSTADPANAVNYHKNADDLLARLSMLEKEIATMVAPVKRVPYVVFHDAYQYLERRFGLNAIGSISVHTGRAPSAKRLYELRSKIVELGANCVFSEPQFESKLVGTVVEGTEAHSGILDPLGADLPPGDDAYFRLMRQFADSLTTCLGQQS